METVGFVDDKIHEMVQGFAGMGAVSPCSSSAASFPRDGEPFFWRGGPSQRPRL